VRIESSCRGTGNHATGGPGRTTSLAKKQDTKRALVRSARSLTKEMAGERKTKAEKRVIKEGGTIHQPVKRKEEHNGDCLSLQDPTNGKQHYQKT